MNYQRIYDAIIERGRNRTLLGYTEEHHIIPQCMGGSDDSDNLVELTAEEHYVCHQLLVKLYPDQIGLVRAAMFMSASHINGPKRNNNKTYGWLKRKFSLYMKTSNPNKNGVARKKFIEIYGVPEVSKSYITTEWCDNISKRMTGDKNPMAGVKPWNHGRATEYTKSVWADANNIYKLWIDNDQPSYCRLMTLNNGGHFKDGDYNTKIGPYMNLVKYFRNGWIPGEDSEWISFTKNA